MNAKMQTLTDLPNLSFRLASELAHTGIDSVETLHRVGAAMAWRKLQAAGFHPDFLALLSLQGAIGGKHWRDLPSDRRLELRSAVPAAF